MCTEDSPSGLWRTLGKRVGCKLSGVRIPHPPPPIRDRQVPDFFMPYLLPLFPAPAYSPGLRSLPLAPPTPGQLNPGPSFTPSPAFSRRRRPTPSLPLPITQHPATSETKNPATHCMTGIDGGSAGIRTRGGLHHTAFRVLHLRPLGHATSAAQFTGDYSQYANLTYPAAVT